MVRGDQFVGVLVCDVCGALIQDADNAVAQVVGRRKMREGSLVDVLHAHAGLCREGAEARIGGQGRPSLTELAEHLSQVARSVGLDLVNPAASETASVQEMLEELS